ncbi:Rrf2 family transcriptional regulator [Paenibacillus sp. PL2-23]|uniref:RrF2 family transcriptional regulator n=1 Tax=Paenibacillus sp. PL2-23 TaxID=2100729 RepID=UPI0030F61855
MSVADKGIDFGPPHFKIAMHAVARLAQKNCVLSSAVIAGQVDSHATFLRRVLQSLAAAGIVESRGGREGGYFLKKPADSLTLGEIYEAVHPGKRECCEEDPCGTGQSECGEAGIQLDRELENILHEAERHTIQYLNQFTLQEVMCRIPYFQHGAKSTT